MTGEHPAAVGFVGAGTIGNPIASRLLDAGHRLVVCDVREAATENLVADFAAGVEVDEIG